LPKIVSLFSGAGGLDLGFSSAGFPLAFAVDNSPAAVETHHYNFPRARAVAADLIDLGPNGVVRHLETVLQPGEAIGVIGGPPCQGFSRANNQSVAADPRNRLPMLYLAIVKSLQERYDVQFVLFENVLGIRDSKHEVVFRSILRELGDLGFCTCVDEHSALDFGVPQTRTRVIIAGFLEKAAADAFSPRKIKRSDLTVRAAIGGLPAPRISPVVCRQLPFRIIRITGRCSRDRRDSAIRSSFTAWGGPSGDSNGTYQARPSRTGTGRSTFTPMVTAA
jgi:DNA (cytosine-5)-methyltransferase 1